MTLTNIFGVKWEIYLGGINPISHQYAWLEKDGILPNYVPWLFNYAPRSLSKGSERDKLFLVKMGFFFRKYPYGRSRLYIYF